MCVTHDSNVPSFGVENSVARSEWWTGGEQDVNQCESPKFRGVLHSRICFEVGLEGGVLAILTLDPT